MNYKSEIRNIYFLFLFAVLILVDQFSKYLIRCWGGFYVCNKNVAFGVELPPAIFWLFWSGIILLLVIASCKKYFIHGTLYIILIMAGAISNIMDRLFFGCVTDFIDLRVWPVFNLADSFIVLGALALLAKKLKT